MINNEGTEVGECIHHWMIEPAYESGTPTSAGACINCGETREFSNSLEYEMYADADHQDAAKAGRTRGFNR